MRPAEELSLDRQITTEGQLLVEGRVPEMFFREMVADCNLNGLIEVRTFGDVGKDNLQTYLEIFTQKAAFKTKVKRLGIIRDAEGQPATAAFQSVQAALRGAQLAPPVEMNKLEGPSLGIGVFVLPDCQSAGMLEDLCLSAANEVDKGDPNGVLPCVDDFLICLDKRGHKPSNPAKSRFAGFALARDVIDAQLGRAAQKGAIPWQANAFAGLKLFLQRVAGR